MIKFSVGGFIAGILVGMIALFTTVAPSETIIVFPTPTNAAKVQYVDRAGMCYLYNKKYVQCDREAQTTPLQ